MEKARAEEEARIQRQRILEDRTALAQALERLEAENRVVGGEIASLRDEQQVLSEQKALLNAEIETARAELKELQGFVGVSARDLSTLLQDSPQNVRRTADHAFLQNLSREGGFPSLDEIQAMMALFLDEIQRSGEVSFHSGLFVDRTGREQHGKNAAFREFYRSLSVRR